MLVLISNCRYATSTLPTDLYGQASVTYGDSFLIVGGRCRELCDPHVTTQDILEWLPEEETFVRRDERLEPGRYVHAAVMVEDNIVDCV